MIWLLLFGCASPTATPTVSQTRAPTVATVDPIIGGLRARPLAYTKHARCRMDCRQISEDEIAEILLVGTIDADRTRTDGECTSYALEGTTSDEQRVRIVYGACSRETLVITAIDLGQDWACGDC